MATPNYAGRPTSYASLRESLLTEGECARSFEAMMQELRAEFQPKSPTENMCVDFMAAARWRERRYRKSEEVLREQASAGLALDQIAPYSRYLNLLRNLQVSAERRYTCALKTLTASRKPRWRSPSR